MQLLEISLTSVRDLAAATGLYLCCAIALAAGDPPANPARDCDSLAKPRPGCLPTSGRVSPSAQANEPSRRLTQEEIEKDKERQKERAERAAAIPPINLSPEEIERETKSAKEHADITLASNRQVFSATADGSKYSIFLDDEKYPVRSLAMTCEPRNAAAIGQLKDGSRGPNLYPLEFVSGLPGKCVVRNKDFAVTIVIRDFQ